MRRPIAPLLNPAWADFALGNPKAVAKAIEILSKHVRGLRQDDNARFAAEDLIEALEDDPTKARGVWAEWVATELTRSRRHQAAAQAETKTKRLLVEDIRKTLHGLAYRHATKAKVSANLGVSERTLDRVLQAEGVTWMQIKTSHPGKT
ncbi:hypothetical protein NBRC116584_34970 [Hydrogenophaga sp. 5NK40-0174]